MRLSAHGSAFAHLSALSSALDRPSAPPKYHCSGNSLRSALRNERPTQGKLILECYWMYTVLPRRSRCFVLCLAFTSITTWRESPLSRTLLCGGQAAVGPSSYGLQLLQCPGYLAVGRAILHPARGCNGEPDRARGISFPARGGGWLHFDRCAATGGRCLRPA